MIAFCPHCDNEFYVPVDLGGTKVKCSKCKKKVLAPEAPDVSEVAVDSVSIQGAALLGVSGTGVVGGQPKRAVNSRQQKAAVDDEQPKPVVDDQQAEPSVDNQQPKSPVDDQQARLAVGAGLRKPVIPSGGRPRLGLSLRPTMPRKSGSRGPAQSLKDSLKKKKRLNIYRGLNRLVFVLSVIALMLGLPEIIVYMIDRSVWRMKDIMGFFVPLPLAAFVCVWAVYGVCLCIVRGFSEVLRGSRSSGLKRLAFVVSLLPLLPGVSFAVRDLVTKPHLRMKEVLGYFIYWPVAGFVGVWIVYIAVLFVLRGFYDKNKSKGLKSRKGRVRQPLETKSVRPGSWRST
jgi:hypothetical protein